jgi:predicted house-cleaning noncanonical NTP pyrophosphatase (MazG superfamily)
MSKITKLVRDKLLDIPHPKHVLTPVPNLSFEETNSFYREKLFEEVQELAQAQTRLEMIEEAADLSQLLFDYLERFDISFVDVTTKAVQKRIERGGFKKGIVVDIE